MTARRRWPESGRLVVAWPGSTEHSARVLVVAGWPLHDAGRASPRHALLASHFGRPHTFTAMRGSVQFHLPSSTAVTGTVERFPIRFDAWYRVLSTSLFISPSDSYVELNGEDVVVRMAWAFRARFHRSTVASTALLKTKPISRGVHGLAGRWLVNGSGDGILTLDLSPPQRGYVLGIPLRLRQLMVSVEDPGALAHALRPGPA